MSDDALAEIALARGRTRFAGRTARDILCGISGGRELQERQFVVVGCNFWARNTARAWTSLAMRSTLRTPLAHDPISPTTATCLNPRPPRLDWIHRRNHVVFIHLHRSFSDPRLKYSSAISRYRGRPCPRCRENESRRYRARIVAPLGPLGANHHAPVVFVDLARSPELSWRCVNGIT